MECENNAGVESALNVAIEGLKANKERDGYANKAMSDAIGEIAKLRKKCIKLEQSNGELRERLAQTEEELDNWKGNAEGFQPDECMKLPLDADGVPIRIGDVVWYVGSDTEIENDCPLKVAGFVTIFGIQKIYIEMREYPDRAIDPESLTHKRPEHPERPEPADSWEKLKKDMLKRSSCSYFRQHFTKPCNDCPHGENQTGFPCWENARLDMLKRAKKLAGIEEEAER